MHESNSLLLQVARAINAMYGNQTAETKARLFYMGNNSLNLLQKKMREQPDIIVYLTDQEQYSAGEWNEVKRFLGQYSNQINSETMEKWKSQLNAELHLALLNLYIPAIKYIQYRVNKKSFIDNTSQADPRRENFDKALKFIRSGNFLQQNPDYSHSPKAAPLLKQYEQIKRDITAYMLLEIDALTDNINDSMHGIMRELVQNSPDIIRGWAGQFTTDSELIQVMERILAHKAFWNEFGDGRLSQSILKECYDGLINYYREMDDLDNLVKFQSKRELLGISGK
jgi:hypothetical protein